MSPTVKALNFPLDGNFALFHFLTQFTKSGSGFCKKNMETMESFHEVES
jgi:hypothetical protein